MGGVSAIIWSSLSLVLGGYEGFKLENSLIGSMYPTGPTASESAPPTEKGAYAALLRTIAGRGLYFYDYSEYMLAKVLTSCCCCRGRCCERYPCFQQRRRKLNRHKEASERLSAEIDIVKLLRSQRTI